MTDVNLLKTSAYDFDLPEELIAQTPLENRDQSRLLILDRDTETYCDGHFTDLLDELEPGDALVMNDSRVMPARIYGIKEETGAHLEVLLLNNTEGDCWEVLMKPAKKAKKGTVIDFGEGKLKAIVREELEHGGRILEFKYDGIFLEILNELGEMPLPPYIKEKLDTPERYQTVYSREVGSAAAPTAGLHFTKDLLHELEEKGIQLIYLTLHVGLGTFRPVSADDLSGHQMHSEYYQLSEKAAKQIRQVQKNGGRIFAVGTTSIRTLESVARDNDGDIVAQSGWTDIFIYPGFEFQVVDGLITNFHLPESTLIMLVSALAGRDFILDSYQHAVSEKYRFFSFGDAMLIK